MPWATPSTKSVTVEPGSLVPRMVGVVALVMPSAALAPESVPAVRPVTVTAGTAVSMVRTIEDELTPFETTRTAWAPSARAVGSVSE
ncbi:hypothetical protein D3C72_2127710 [compost metagenome]